MAKLTQDNQESSNQKPLWERFKNSFVPRAQLSKQVYVSLAIFTFLAIFAVWSYITMAGLVDPLFMPTIQKVISSAISMFAEQDYINDIAITVSRVMLGFLITTVISVPLGILVGTYRPFEALLEPLFSFIRYLPVSAFIPLFILWIGIDENAKVAVIIMGSLPPLILMIASTIKNIPTELIQVAYTLGTSKTSILWKVIFPASMPAILDSLRMVLGWAWTYVVVAEMVGASSGIGYRIIQAQRMLSVAEIFVGILCIGLIGLIFDTCFKWLYRVLFSWSEG